MKKLIAAMFLIAGSANAVEQFTVDWYEPWFYNTKVFVNLGNNHDFQNLDNCHSSVAHRMISIDWTGKSEAEQKGRALQVTQMMSNQVQGKPTRFHTSGCTSDGLAKVYLVK